MSAVPSKVPPVIPGRNPTWVVANYFPEQGQWTEESYLEFAEGKRGLELVGGRLEELPVPTEKHQDIILYLIDLLRAFIIPRKLGKAQIAGLRVRLGQNEFREPDVVFIRDENRHRRSNAFWIAADLVMEVVSEDDRNRDYVEKRTAYASAGVAEYWIVDPTRSVIVVLVLRDGDFVEAGCYSKGDVAKSVTLDGFGVPVTECLTAGDD
jgi:Uma2 family endonuclease